MPLTLRLLRHEWRKDGRTFAWAVSHSLPACIIPTCLPNSRPPRLAGWMAGWLLLPAWPACRCCLFGLVWSPRHLSFSVIASLINYYIAGWIVSQWVMAATSTSQLRRRNTCATRSNTSTVSKNHTQPNLATAAQPLQAHPASQPFTEAKRFHLITTSRLGPLPA